MRTLIAVSIIAAYFAVALAAKAQTSTPSAPKLVQYESPDHAFKLLYLSNWEPRPSDNEAVQLKLLPKTAKPDAPSAVVLVIVPPLPNKSDGSGATLDDIQQGVVDIATRGNTPDAKSVISTSATLGGQPARRVLMTGTDKRDGAAFKAVVYLVMHKGKGYAVAFAAPAEEFTPKREAFDKLIEAFTFVD